MAGGAGAPGAAIRAVGAMGIRAGWSAAVAALVACGVSAQAQAADPPRLADALTGRAFFFGGVDVARDSQSAWSGFVAAPIGRLDQDGARLRLMGGLGQYRYDTAAVPGGVNEGDVASGELMFGWRHGIERAVVTVYFGALIENHRLRSPDPGNPVAGSKAGVKGALEFYWRPQPEFIVTASASASTVHRKYDARLAYARELAPAFAVGVDVALLGDARYREPRAGLFATTSFARSRVTLASGVLSNSEKGGGAYLTVSLYSPF